MPTPDSATLNAIFGESQDERRQDQAVPMPVRKKEEPWNPSAPAFAQPDACIRKGGEPSFIRRIASLPIPLFTRLAWQPRRTDRVSSCCGALRRWGPAPFGRSSVTDHHIPVHATQSPLRHAALVSTSSPSNAMQCAPMVQSCGLPHSHPSLSSLQGLYQGA